MVRLNLPVGISDFRKIRENNYYYIDKTGLITELLGKSSAEVTLITRPRRFGKTLGMSMLDCFFNIQTDSSDLFAGLEISKNTALTAEWQNKWPVLFLSFRQVDGLNFQSSSDMLSLVIRNVFKRHLYLLDSDRVNPYDKQSITHILDETASITEIKNCLILLTGAMQAHYQKSVILLIDEYRGDPLLVRWIPLWRCRCLLPLGCHKLYVGSPAQPGCETCQLLEEYK